MRLNNYIQRIKRRYLKKNKPRKKYPIINQRN